MGVQDAIDTRALAQRIKAVHKPMVENFFNERALLKLTEKRIKWNASHTDFDWYIRNVPSGETATFGNPSGELAVLTFEEQKPANKLTLPFCYITKTYGVGERTLEANRNATDNKIFDVVKENYKLAQIFMYDAMGPSIYNKNLTSEDPVGLLAMVGNPINTSGVAIVSAGETYAGKTLNTAASTNEGDLLVTNGNDTNSRGWDDAQFAPTVASVEGMSGAMGLTLDKWTTGSVEILQYMAEKMSVTASISGTGTRIKPDIALMGSGSFSAVRGRLVAAQSGGYQIPLGRKVLVMAGFSNVQVDTLTCVKDTDVPLDANTTPEPMVFVLDSSQFNIVTTHKKSEGLIKSEFDPDVALIAGVVGRLQANFAYYITSPTAIGCVVGCND